MKWRNLFLILSLLLASGEGEVIEKVVFQGNRGIKSQILSQLIISQKGRRFSEEDWQEDINSLSEFYKKNGFFSARIFGKTTKGRKGLVLTFLIEEGVRCRIESIAFLKQKDKGGAKILEKNRPKFYSEAEIEKLEERLRDYYVNLGYYYVDVSIETTFLSPEKMNLLVSVAEGPLAYLKEIRFFGLQRVRLKDALRTTELKPGERYSKKRLYEAARKLYGTNLFGGIYFKVSPVDEEKKRESLLVRFDCQELKERIFEFGLGYASPPRRTYHSFTWQHLNFFRKAHNLKISLELNPDWRGSYKAGLTGDYRVPYISYTKINFFFRPYLSLDVDKNREERIWELKEEGGFYYDFTPNLVSHLFNKYRRLWGERDSVRTITNSLNLNLFYDTRDDFFSPNSGVYSFSSVEYAGSFLGGTSDFYRFSQEVRLFCQFLFTQGFRLGVGFIKPYGRTKAVPDYEKFFLGGMTTLRGYDEKSLSGEMMVLFNWEMRFPIKKVLSGVLFFDSGVTEMSDGKLGYDFGVGLRVLSPVGPLRLDYAVVPKRFAQKNWWKINFGLGNIF
jgi:outer membrane protein insertion porin family